MFEPESVAVPAFTLNTVLPLIAFVTVAFTMPPLLSCRVFWLMAEALFRFSVPVPLTVTAVLPKVPPLAMVSVPLLTVVAPP